MATEFEAKILDIDVDSIIIKLNSLGAKKILERDMRRYVYDFNPKRDDSWIRLRDDGEKCTLTIKEIHDDSVSGTEETEIIVSSFNDTNILLGKLGYSPKGYQENKRISYSLEGTAIEIDFWPLIPPYIEVEAESSKKVKETLEKLGFSIEQSTSQNTTKVYARYGIDIASIKELKF